MIAETTVQPTEHQTKSDLDKVFAYYATFRVELPGDPSSIESDEARSHVSAAIISALQNVSSHYALSVDYSVSYECRTRVPIPVIPHG
jgi:hypothetical protein